ncbi:cation diffusion facilitator family transporter [Ornithinimicrobium sp. Y1847]|uniref:cation diffusion facilitator family transporter n=1 Tax=unclassified Ornithinimicrobium TaxID=2615080 RepID=UPI003B67EB51
MTTRQGAGGGGRLSGQGEGGQGSGEGRSHSHSHSHSHGAGSSRTRLAIAFGLTAVVVLAQVIGALITGSLALLVDSVHSITDSAGLLLALTAAVLMERPPNDRRTWGLARVEVLAAGAQATILLGVGIFALVEGVRRLTSEAPPEIPGGLVLIFGAVGLAANLIALAVLAGGRGANLNMRAAFLEVLNDALGSVAVIISAIVIMTTGWHRADAIAGILIALLIMPRAVVILHEAGSVLLESAPPGLDLADVRAHILELDHVLEVHDLHASRIGTGTPVLTAHVVVEEECFRDDHVPQLLDALQQCVAEHFDVSVEHSTFQLEPPGHTAHEVGHHP